MIVLSFFLERHDVGGQIIFVYLVEPLFSGANLSEIGCCQSFASKFTI